jgi:hypothetical protein
MAFDPPHGQAARLRRRPSVLYLKLGSGHGKNKDFGISPRP